MMFAVSLQQASLSDPPPASVIASAANWVSGLLFGPLATAIAVIAIAWVGLAMLSGRIEIRRGASVVLGCFLLFGAKGIADGFRSGMSNDNVPSIANMTPPVTAPIAVQPDAASTYDPYAGASVAR